MNNKRKLDDSNEREPTHYICIKLRSLTGLLMWNVVPHH